MNGPGFEQGMRQNMQLGAAMQLYLRALQASQIELSQLVTQALYANPTLEEATPPPDDSLASSPTDSDASSRHDFLMDSLTRPLSLAEHLEEQVRQSALPRQTEEDALAIIARMDARGFLSDPPNIPPARLAKALRVVQDLDPAGVGASDIRESLLLQLQRVGEQDSPAFRIIHDAWDDFIRRRFPRIARALGITEEIVTAAAHRISRLNPDPGSAFAPVEHPIIFPDVLVERTGDELTVSLTGSRVPNLVISAQYRTMLAEQGDKPGVRRYLSHCFREGRALIRAIEKRQETILAVARAIVARQHPFFFRGPSRLLPLRMEEIADAVRVHVSTVSRAVNGKFLRCSFGVFELRSFFSVALPSDSGAQTGAAVKAQIRALIDAENPSSPLSDASIENLLAARGIRVARRTIAKYRDQLRILPASLRKK